ncbi:MAG: hypothetical protein PHW76_00300 [Alphaproteobacteria bacterium]|nr:hypothetical protein [Alphaproteobacteria bacterium]
MTEKQTSENLNWLNATLEVRRLHLNRLLSRIKDFALTAFPLHKKFMRLLDQIAFEQKKERAIINQIEAIEKLHQDLKRRKLLEQRAQNAKLRRERNRKEDDDWIFLLRQRNPKHKEGESLVELLIVAGLLSSFSKLFDKLFKIERKPEPK